MEANNGQTGGGGAPAQECRQTLPSAENPTTSETVEPVSVKQEPDKNEADSTIADDPVNLKREPNDSTANEASIAEPAREQVEQSSSMPQQHQVRTITLNSEYRQQENAPNSISQQSDQKFTDHAATHQSTAMYVEEQSSSNQPAVYYQEQQDYTQESAESAHYARDVSNENKPNKLLESAAAEAGVPTNDYMITMEEDVHGDPGSSASYLGSRLATMQVIHSNKLLIVLG